MHRAGGRVAGGGLGGLMRAVLAGLFGAGYLVVAVSQLLVAPAPDAAGPDGGARLMGWAAVAGIVVCVALVVVNLASSRSPERRVALRPVARRVAVLALAAQAAVVLVVLASYLRLSDVFADAAVAALELLFATLLAVSTWRSARPTGWARTHP